MKLEHLIDSIKKSNRMNADEIIRHLAAAINEGKTAEDLSREMYVENYGHTLTNEIIVEWVKSMKVTDGSERDNGQKWNVDSTTEAGNKIGIKWDKINKYEFYGAMNMMYSDHYGTAEAYDHAGDPLFFARLAKDFLCDEDAGENKMFNYYFNVIL